MKTFLTTTILLVLFYFTSAAQIIGDVRLADIDAEYLQVTFADRIGGKVSVHLDFGQASVEYNPRNTLLRSDNNKAMEFNSMMDAVNFLSRYNYALVEVYTITKETSSTPFYILKKDRKNIH